MKKRGWGGRIEEHEESKGGMQTARKDKTSKTNKHRPRVRVNQTKKTNHLVSSRKERRAKQKEGGWEGGARKEIQVEIHSSEIDSKT